MFKNKIVAITGAGSGIGRALAIGLAKRGSILALSDINEASVNETLTLLPPSSKAKVYIVNVSDKDQVYKFADDVEQDFGTAHFIFNNAGTSVFGSVESLSVEEIQGVVDINLWGVIYGTKAFLSKMLTQKEGCIVNISSVFGLVASPCQSPYNISKFAVRGFTETLWSELKGTGVRAVLVHPGGIATGIKNTSLICKNGGEFEKRISDASNKTLVTPPEECAEEILEGLVSKKSRLLVGSGAKAVFWLSRIFPNRYMDFMGKKVGL